MVIECFGDTAVYVIHILFCFSFVNSHHGIHCTEQPGCLESRKLYLCNSLFQLAGIFSSWKMILESGKCYGVQINRKGEVDAPVTHPLMKIEIWLVKHWMPSRPLETWSEHYWSIISRKPKQSALSYPIIIIDLKIDEECMRRLVYGFALKHSEQALNKDHIFTKNKHL